MEYYLQIKNEEILSCSNLPVIDSDIENLPITEKIFEDYKMTPSKYYIEDGELKSISDADIREANFKSKFFEITDYGWFRKVPKGYSSAVESMNVAYNIATEKGGIGAGLIIFYQQPDFTKPEECTEEWLINHQIIQPAMTKEAFIDLYESFITAWNTEEHE